MATVTKEIAKPRIAKSAQVDADELSRKKHGNPARHHAGEPSKLHLEQYGMGTPSVKNKS